MEQFDHLVSKAKQIQLTPEEKEAIKKQVMAYAYAHPVSFPVLLLQKPFVRYALATLMMAMFTGTGASFAAQSSLPGDFLYPVKTQVNEKVLGFTMLSDTAKAQYDMQLVKTRLQEIATINSRATADTQVDAKKTEQAAALLKVHIQDGKKRTKNIKRSNDEVTIKNAENVSADNDAKVTEYYDTLQEVTDLLETTKAKVSSQAKVQASSGMDSATADMMAGEMKLGQKDSDGASVLFENGVQKLREVKVRLNEQLQAQEAE